MKSKFESCSYLRRQRASMSCAVRSGQAMWRAVAICISRSSLDGLMGPGDSRKALRGSVDRDPETQRVVLEAEGSCVRLSAWLLVAIRPPTTRPPLACLVVDLPAGPSPKWRRRVEKTGGSSKRCLTLQSKGRHCRFSLSSCCVTCAWPLSCKSILVRWVGGCLFVLFVHSLKDF